MGFSNQEAKAPKVPKVPLTPEEQALQDKKNAKLNAGLGAGLGAASTVLGTLDTDPEIGAMDYAKNATSMAATGATVGGPVGAGVGAVVGLGMTYFQQQQQKEAQKAKEQAESLNIGIQRQQFQAVAEGGLIGHVQKLVDGNEVQSPVIPQVQQASYINEDPYNVASFTKKMNEAKQQMFDSRITPRDASVSIPSSLSPQAQQSIINSNIEKAQSNLVATSFKTKEQIAKEANYTKAAEDRDKRLQTEGKALKLVGKGVGALMGFNPEHPVESIPETLATGLVLGGIGHHAVQKLAAKEAASVATSGAAKAGMERLGINAIKAAEGTHKAVHVDHAITEPKKILAERASGGAIPDNTTYGKQAVNKGMKKGGPVIGPGTGTSDSVRTSLQPGDFVVPAMNASLAIQLRQMYLGGSVDAIKPGEKNGSAPVALSNGEHVFTKDERMMLEKQGVNLDRLAPNAEKTGYGMVKGGVVGNRNIKTKVTSEVQSADGNQKLETAEKAAVTRKKFDQKFKELYKNPNVRAYLNGIMHGEALPQNPSTGKNPDSSATGYFQFLEGTNKDILERYGFTGQSKDIEESAKAAIALMNDKDAIKDIVAGNFDEADKKLNKIWTSLPGGNESNVKTDSIPTLRKEYIENKGQIKSVQGAKSYIPFEDKKAEPSPLVQVKSGDSKGVVAKTKSNTDYAYPETKGTFGSRQKGLRFLEDPNADGAPAEPAKKKTGSEKFDEYKTAVQEKLEKDFPGKYLVTISGDKRSLKQQKEHLAKGESQSVLSTHMLGAARDINIIEKETKRVIGNKGDDLKLYKDYAWKTAEENGLFHLKGGEGNFGDTDPYHIGLVEEKGDGTAFQRLLTEYPELTETKEAQDTIAEIREEIKNNPDSAKSYAPLIDAIDKKSTTQTKPAEVKATSKDSKPFDYSKNPAIPEPVITNGKMLSKDYVDRIKANPDYFNAQTEKELLDAVNKRRPKSAEEWTAVFDRARALTGRDIDPNSPEGTIGDVMNRQSPMAELIRMRRDEVSKGINTGNRAAKNDEANRIAQTKSEYKNDKTLNPPITPPAPAPEGGSDEQLPTQEDIVDPTTERRLAEQAKSVPDLMPQSKGILDGIKPSSPEQNIRKEMSPKASVSSPIVEDAELNIFNKLGGIGGLAALGQTAFGLAGLVSNQKNDPGPYKGDPYLTVLRNQASLDATRLDPAIKAEGERQIELTRRTRNAEIQRMSAGDTGLAMGAMRESAIDKSRGIMGLAALQEQTMDSRKQYLGQRADAVTNDNMRVYDSKNNRFMMNQQAAAGLLNTGITNFIGATNYSQYMNQLASAEGDPAAMQIKMGQQIANTPVLPPPTVTPPIDPIK